MTSQSQSRLVSLPGELRNQIFNLALAADAPIVNPYFEPSARPRHRQVPALGTALSRTCHAVHNELDLDQLLKHNTLVFTRVAHLHAFRNRLTRHQMRLIRSVTIDLREASVSDGDDAAVKTGDIISNEWLHYLSCDHYAHVPGVWCSRLATLTSDLPDLKELVVDLTGWQSPFAGVRIGGWKYLQHLLGNVKGMDSISLKGKCLSTNFWNPEPMPWGVGPWFSPAYSNDDSSLLELLGAGVRASSSFEKKVFSWTFEDGVTTLQVKVLSTRSANAVAETCSWRTATVSGVRSWDALVEAKRNRHADSLGKAFQAPSVPQTITWDVLPLVAAASG